ncbi:hypothetical protein GWI33_014925 [Rhynchophorus ferrugineus]|uniref:Uncharacterized protein n=1 Tax=Rhynchophorus ferrugineus TaxID=354439 RepID=A0A834MBW4_RHYFE|nr:hypothetical protein GWI33_014925 [Rhynchophorus ferrugineus]
MALTKSESCWLDLVGKLMARREEGEPDSEVFGSIRDGIFEGKIVLPKGSFYVEKAHHYFPHEKHPNLTFHSVIYQEDHVQDPYENIREGKPLKVNDGNGRF